MRKTLLTAVAVLFCWGATAQTSGQGMKFTDGTFAQVLKAAETDDKPIFIDIYTGWCGPCKYLSANIFPTQEAGEYMNARFINAKFDAEQGEGKVLASRYTVKGYPTMLILNSKGEEIGRLVGARRTPADFVNDVRKVLEKNSN